MGEAPLRGEAKGGGPCGQESRSRETLAVEQIWREWQDPEDLESRQARD